MLDTSQVSALRIAYLDCPHLAQCLAQSSYLINIG